MATPQAASGKATQTARQRWVDDQAFSVFLDGFIEDLRPGLAGGVTALGDFRRRADHQRMAISDQ